MILGRPLDLVGFLVDPMSRKVRFLDTSMPDAQPVCMARPALGEGIGRFTGTDRPAATIAVLELCSLEYTR